MTDRHTPERINGANTPQRITGHGGPKLSSENGQEVSGTPLQNLINFVEHVEGAIAIASNNEDAALAAIAEVEHWIVRYLKECAVGAVGSGSTFNQGVVRGLEIAAAQVEHGHYQRRARAAEQVA